MQRAGSIQGGPGHQVPVGRERKFMRVREVARMLDFSEMSIRRAWQAGDIPGIAYGTSCRILTAFVIALVAEAEAGRQVRIEDFGRQWTKRNGSPEAVA